MRLKTLKFLPQKTRSCGMKQLRWVLSALAIVGLIGVVATSYTPPDEGNQPRMATAPRSEVPSCCAGRTAESGCSLAAAESGGCCPSTNAVAAIASLDSPVEESGSCCPTAKAAALASLDSPVKESGSCCPMGKAATATVAEGCSTEGCEGCPFSRNAGMTLAGLDTESVSESAAGSVAEAATVVSDGAH